MPENRPYPARIDATLDQPLSRWLWLVKWLLAVPHYLCLAFLWIAFVLLTVVAFFAILFTGRYPRAIFDFNVGVLRWAWRVSYYTTGGFGTDRYPPFTLNDVPDYPAHYDVDYPEHLSRGLVLVKSWLLAIPHWIIVGIFVGGGAWAASGRDGGGDWRWSWGGGGLVFLLALVAAVVLLFRGTYPESLFDVILGLDRWVYRVAAYVALMTDEYPPFRLDLGGTDPGTLARTGGEPPPSAAGAAAGAAAGPRTATPRQPTHWGGGRIVMLVAGSLLALAATGPVIGGVALGAVDRFGRDGGYVTSPSSGFVSAGRAVTSDGIQLEADGPRWALPDRILGTVRVRVTPADPARAMFVGIARTSDVRAYLGGAAYSSVGSLRAGDVNYVQHTGNATPPDPASRTFWAAKATGTGAQTLTWSARSGEWSVVMLNADISPGVSADADFAATVPALGWLAAGLLVVGLVILAVGAVLILLAVRARDWGTPPAPPPATGPGTTAPQQPSSLIG
jgi:hypothetical protein